MRTVRMFQISAHNSFSATSDHQKTIQSPSYSYVVFFALKNTAFSRRPRLVSIQLLRRWWNSPLWQRKSWSFPNRYRSHLRHRCSYIFFPTQCSMHCRRQHLGCVELKLHDGDSIAAPWLIAGVLDCSRSNKIICGGKLMDTHSTWLPGKIIRPQWNNEIFQKVHIHNGRWHDSLFNIYHKLFLI